MIFSVTHCYGGAKRKGSKLFGSEDRRLSAKYKDVVTWNASIESDFCFAGMSQLSPEPFLSNSR